MQNKNNALFLTLQLEATPLLSLQMYLKVLSWLPFYSFLIFVPRTQSPFSPDAHMTKHADDIVTLLPIKVNTDSDTALNDAIKSITNWYYEKDLVLNEQKTKVMFFKEQAYVTNPLTNFPIANELKIL